MRKGGKKKNQLSAELPIDTHRMGNKNFLSVSKIRMKYVRSFHYNNMFREGYV
jgi:hypothetical protein